MIHISTLAIAFLLSTDGGTVCADTEPFCILEEPVDQGLLEERLDGLDEAYWVDGNTITVAARRETGGVFFCCAIQAPMRQSQDSDYWYLSVTIPRLEEAFIDIIPIPFDGPNRLTQFLPLEYRGDHAIAPVSRAPVADGTIEVRTMESVALGVTRRVTVYVPPELNEGTNRPIVYLADGQGTIAYAQIVRSLIDNCRIEPVMLAGLWHGEVENGTTPQQTSEQRSRDYLWGFEGNIFVEHENFFLNEVMPLVETEFLASDVPTRRSLFGKSSGAAWALSTALRNPTEFGAIGAVSAVWSQSLNAAEPQSGPHYYLSVGLFEDRAPSLLTNIVERFADAGVGFSERTYVSGHSPLVFDQAFSEMLLAEFPLASDNACINAN